MKLDNKQKRIIRNLVHDEFAKRVVEVAMSDFESNSSDLSYNYFALAIREAKKHDINVRAPEEVVRTVSWADAANTGRLPRKIKLRYLIQRNIPDKYINSLEQIKNRIQDLDTCLDELNDYVHVCKTTFGCAEDEIRNNIQGLIEAIENYNSIEQDILTQLQTELIDNIEDTFYKNYLLKGLGKIEQLVPHVELNDVTYDISNLEFCDDRIELDVTGDIECTLIYGSMHEYEEDDDIGTSESFPYSWKLFIPLVGKFELHSEERPDIDTNSLYE